MGWGAGKEGPTEKRFRLTAGALQGSLKCGWVTSMQEWFWCPSQSAENLPHPRDLPGGVGSEDSAPQPPKVRVTKAQQKSKEKLLLQRELLKPNRNT